MIKKLFSNSVFILAVFYSCKPENSEKLICCEEVPINLIESGDRRLYDSLSLSYFKCSCLEKLLFYSLMFAEEHNYDRAYVDCYNIYNNYYEFGDNERLANLTLYYLARAKECGYKFDSLKFQNSYVKYHQIRASYLYRENFSRFERYIEPSHDEVVQKCE